MIPPLWLIVISCASFLIDLCRSMCYKSIYQGLLGAFTAEDSACRYAKKLSIQSKWNDACLNITSTLIPIGWQRIGSISVNHHERGGKASFASVVHSISNKIQGNHFNRWCFDSLYIFNYDLLRPIKQYHIVRTDWSQEASKSERQNSWN